MKLQHFAIHLTVSGSISWGTVRFMIFLTECTFLQFVVCKSTFFAFVSKMSRLAIFIKLLPHTSFNTTLFHGIEASLSHVMC